MAIVFVVYQPFRKLGLRAHYGWRPGGIATPILDRFWVVFDCFWIVFDRFRAVLHGFRTVFFCFFADISGFGCLSCPWVSLLSLGVSLVLGCFSCLRVSVLGCLSCPWVPLSSFGVSLVLWVPPLSLGVSLVLGCFSCPWVSLLSLVELWG